MAKGDAEQVLLAKSIAHHAVASHAKREADRDILVDGQKYAVNLRVKGTVNLEKVSYLIRGDLSVGTTNPTGSTQRPDALQLLCEAVELLPKTRRKLYFQRVPIDVSEETKRSVLALVAEHSTKHPKRGAVKFIAS